ncbi:hypothetical protein COL27_29635, partial [Bacillus sp. AFS075960]
SRELVIVGGDLLLESAHPVLQIRDAARRRGVVRGCMWMVHRPRNEKAASRAAFGVVVPFALIQNPMPWGGTHGERKT